MAPELETAHSRTFVSRLWQVAAAISVSLFALAAFNPSMSDDANPAAAEDKNVLRVCAAAKELPYSADDESGFENKIAKILADSLGRKAEFVWFQKDAIYAVRDQLDKNLCDVIIGTDTNDPRVLTSKPYYRAAYVFIQRKDSPLKIDSFDSPDIVKANPIGFVQGTPAETMITKLDLYNDNINYVSSLTNFKDKRNSYTRVPPDRMVGEVASGKSELAIGFAPEVARYVKANDALKLTVIPDNNVRDDGQRVPFHFDQSFAVRKDEKDLMAAINTALPGIQKKIDVVLKDEGIPFEAPQPPT
ncbi:methanol oxidation system protein MoxJ [Hyphomicrobium sp. MC1]|uniref:methanol oxidation system protein MoxJ n=1 Tax=Hyphomicrobium sp. (strain MC1) TaxID=717785 RepID=UPI000213F77B|nr:methanol oxidation system protein MoxJ [Hyphomicrobium sp. MC1]CCB63720.1 methanol oxidation protein MxaJ [Hyphomicrobium sp. MC1]